jgi:hypothetical protein
MHAPLRSRFRRDVAQISSGTIIEHAGFFMFNQRNKKGLKHTKKRKGLVGPIHASANEEAREEESHKS